jgi:hypothetical protein
MKTPARKIEPLTFELPPGLAGERVLTLDQVSELTTLSIDTLTRAYSDKILYLSPKRRGMKLKHAVSLGQAKGR